MTGVNQNVERGERGRRSFAAFVAQTFLSALREADPQAPIDSGYLDHPHPKPIRDTWIRHIQGRLKSLRYTCGPAARLCLLLLCLLPLSALAEQRFPPPDFVETSHQLPLTTTPGGRAWVWEYVDIAVLAGALGLSTWFIYRKRSRRSLTWLSLFSVAYFGFWRNGCVCAIGSVQNVALALCDKSYVVPLSVVAFFVLPLAVSVFAGRSFCAGVCPHGALQDLVLLKPIKLPLWLEQPLGVLPFIYLGAGVLFAATGSTFIFCQYDPFVPIFRLNGRVMMVACGVVLLLLGTFVGRPYCRFLCPYGALLKLGALVAKWRVRVTPDYCTQCRLCEASCPFGAMRQSDAAKVQPAALARDRRRLGGFIVLLPILVALGLWLGGRCSVPASRLHPTVALAEQLMLQKTPAPPRSATPTPDELALDRAGQAPKELVAQAVEIRNQFVWGGRLFGGWVGLVFGLKLIRLSMRRKRADYEPDRGDCFACARCFEFCPNELVRRGLVPPPAQGQGTSKPGSA
jgi:polyferredoxin